MLKRNSNFTLIELIVVIVVLGILAAIVIPNISSFAKQAREAQYTADLRNIQTGFDMESANSENLDSGLVIDSTDAAVTVTTELDAEAGYKTVDVDLKLVDIAKMVPNELRKLPKYVVNVDSTTALKTVADATAAIDNKKKYVFVAVQVDEAGKSKAVLNYVGKTAEAINQEADADTGAVALTVAKDTLYIVR